MRESFHQIGIGLMVLGFARPILDYLSAEPFAYIIVLVGYLVYVMTIWSNE